MSSNVQDAKRGISPKKIGARMVRSFKDMRGEMKRVVWPTKKQILNNTGIVLMFMLIASVVVGLFDIVLSQIIKFSLGMGV